MKLRIVIEASVADEAGRDSLIEAGGSLLAALSDGTKVVDPPLTYHSITVEEEDA